MNGVCYKKAILFLPIKDEMTLLKFNELEKSGKLDDFFLEAFEEKIKREHAGTDSVVQTNNKDLELQVATLTKTVQMLETMMLSGNFQMQNIPNKGLDYGAMNSPTMNIPTPKVVEQSQTFTPNVQETTASKPTPKPAKKKRKRSGISMDAIMGMAGSME